MEIIILQHIKVEDPGYIKDLMLKDGINLTTIELDEGKKIPEDLNKFDVFGMPQRYFPKQRLRLRGSYLASNRIGSEFQDFPSSPTRLDLPRPA